MSLTDVYYEAIRILAEFVTACYDEGDAAAIDGLTGTSAKDAQVLRVAFAGRGYTAAAAIMEKIADNRGTCPVETT